MATKADFDAEMVARATVPLLTAAGLSVLTDGTNPDTVSPLRWAFAFLKLTPISGVTVTDADLAAITFKTFNNLCDLGEFRFLTNVVSALTKNRIQVGVNSIYYSDMRDALIRRLAKLEDGLNAQFGINRTTLTGATITLDNYQKCTTTNEQGW